LAQFEPSRYDDPQLRAFAAQKVEVYPDPAVKGSGAKVDIEMDDGTAHSARCEHPLGSFENPLSRAQIERKFRTYAEGALPNAAADAVVQAVDRLEDFGSVGKLMALLNNGSTRDSSRGMAAAE
jgi:2-methylcitrate dehydratase PrpD